MPDVSKVDEIQTILQRHRYRIYQVQEERIKAFPRIIPDPHYLDWLFTRKPPDELKALALIE